METPLIVACVFKPGNGFNAEYVTRLRDSVKQHCQVKHRFVCLTTQNIAGVECLPLTENRIGYWNKLALFERDLFQGSVIYLDLDTMLIKDVTDIFTYPHEFTAGANWKPRIKDGSDTLNSGFMAWDGREDLSHLNKPITRETYELYEQDNIARRGDQGYIQDHLGRPFENIHELFPGRYVSYKWEVRRQGRIPEGASIIGFHGKPRPHEINWRLPDGD